MTSLETVKSHLTQLESALDIDQINAIRSEYRLPATTLGVDEATQETTVILAEYASNLVAARNSGLPQRRRALATYAATALISGAAGVGGTLGYQELTRDDEPAAIVETIEPNRTPSEYQLELWKILGEERALISAALFEGDANYTRLIRELVLKDRETQELSRDLDLPDVSPKPPADPDVGATTDPDGS